jgi:hypothetical protein
VNPATAQKASSPRDEPWLTKQELADKLGVTTRTIERWAVPHLSAGRGGRNRYLLSQAEAFLSGVPEEGGNVIRFPSERTRGQAA